MAEPAAALPRIRRARGFRLYGLDGRRYLDLWQDGGRAILGHGAGPALSAARNALSTGLLPCLPSIHGERLERALARRFPAHACARMFATQARALDAAARALGAPLAPGDLFDPAVDPRPTHPPRALLWRPWLPGSEAELLDAADVLVPVLPFAVAEAPAIVCVRTALQGALPGSDPLPGFLLAGVLRALEALLQDTPPSEELRRLDHVLEGCPGWERRGRYLKPRCIPGHYPAVHRQFLQAGVLLSPVFPGPSILPATLSAGEGALLAGLFQKTHGG